MIIALAAALVYLGIGAALCALVWVELQMDTRGDYQRRFLGLRNVTLRKWAFLLFTWPLVVPYLLKSDGGPR